MYLELITPYIGASSEIVAQKVEAGAIRRFAIASLETDPIYYDEEYAKTTPYGAIIAPPNFSRTFYMPPVRPVEGEILPIRGRVHGTQEFVFFKPMKAGDTIYFRSTVVSAREKQGKSGCLLFVTFEHAVLDENGEPYSLGYNTSVYKESLLKSTDPNRFTTWYPMIPSDDWLMKLPCGGAKYASVGDTIGSVEFPEITRTWIAQWAGATGDFNPIHLDDMAAERAGMGGCIAHGMLTATIVTRVFSRWLGKNGRVAKSHTKFSSPVKPEDHLVLDAIVVSRAETSEGIEVEWEYTVKNAANFTVLAGTIAGVLEAKA